MRPKINFRTHFAQRDTFEGSLDSLDFITLKGMKILVLLLEEMGKRYGGKCPRLDWVDSTEEAQETELVALRKINRILSTELEGTRKENAASS
ncbi:hypothetical protein TNIN_244381 [Trichonephila inaurata madagascariensis]|uniref:Uncharacterized protein n=1 Tax=Trichonephila inaurata madagascariensis TaxID=2747483 RepID=A0A8X6WNE9_9ARAC|nr:hypothetical protein TNIN_244381 [Trichonephila inaurata madagascariensis]